MTQGETWSMTCTRIASITYRKRSILREGSDQKQGFSTRCSHKIDEREIANEDIEMAIVTTFRLVPTHRFRKRENNWRGNLTSASIQDCTECKIRTNKEIKWFIMELTSRSKHRMVSYTTHVRAATMKQNINHENRKHIHPKPDLPEQRLYIKLLRSETAAGSGKLPEGISKTSAALA